MRDSSGPGGTKSMKCCSSFSFVDSGANHVVGFHGLKMEKRILCHCPEKLLVLLLTVRQQICISVGT